MPATREPKDPLTEFISEASAAAMTAGLAAPPAGADVAALLSRFTSFEADAPADQGYERILLIKDPAWFPESGNSVKPGNLRFNLGTLFEAIASGVAAGFSVGTPIVAVLTGLLAIRQLIRAATVDLSDRDALVIWSLWSCERRGDPATIEMIRSRALAEAAQVGSATRPSAAEIEHSLDRLARLGTVRQAKDGTWETREAVTVRT